MSNNLSYIVSAIDKFSPTMGKISNSLSMTNKKILESKIAFKGLSDKLGSANNFLGDTGARLQGAGKSLTRNVTAPILLSGAALGGFAVNAFSEYEDGLAKVGKTADIEGKELDALGMKFRTLNKVLPVGRSELLEYGAVAAQLGVKGSDNLLKFAEVSAKLEGATNVSGEEGALAIARILNISGDIKDVDRFGASLVDLGNNFAATEAEILGNANRIAQATAQFKVSSQNILGLGVATKAVGLRAEQTGSAVGKVFLKIQEGLEGGGEQSAAIARLTDFEDSEKAMKAFGKDSFAFFRKFIGGLAKFKSQGESISSNLGSIGLTGVEINNVIPVLAENIVEVDKALKTSNRAWIENNALNNEFAKQSITLSKRMTVFKNRISDVFIDIGQKLSPKILELTDRFTKFVEFLGNNPEVVILAGKFALLAAAIGPVLLVAGSLITAFSSLIGVGISAIPILAAIGGAMAGISAPVLFIVAAFAAAGLAIFSIFRWEKPLRKFGSNIFDSVSSGILSLMELINTTTDTLFGKKFFDVPSFIPDQKSLFDGVDPSDTQNVLFGDGSLTDGLLTSALLTSALEGLGSSIFGEGFLKSFDKLKSGLDVSFQGALPAGQQLLNNPDSFFREAPSSNERGVNVNTVQTLSPGRSQNLAETFAMIENQRRQPNQSQVGKIEIDFKNLPEGASARVNSPNLATEIRTGKRGARIK